MTVQKFDVRRAEIKGIDERRRRGTPNRSDDAIFVAMKGLIGSPESFWHRFQVGKVLESDHSYIDWELRRLLRDIMRQNQLV